MPQPAPWEVMLTRGRHRPCKSPETLESALRAARPYPTIPPAAQHYTPLCPDHCCRHRCNTTRPHKSDSSHEIAHAAPNLAQIQALSANFDRRCPPCRLRAAPQHPPINLQKEGPKTDPTGSDSRTAPNQVKDMARVTAPRHMRRKGSPDQRHSAPEIGRPPPPAPSRRSSA